MNEQLETGKIYTDIMCTSARGHYKQGKDIEREFTGVNTSQATFLSSTFACTQRQQ